MSLFFGANLLDLPWIYAAPLLVLCFIVGACLGSFINCYAWRTTNGESVVEGRSHCPSCGHVLGACDLVPIFSWLFLRGKCRHCGSPVSPRYLATELLLGLYFVSMFLMYGATVHTLAVWFLGCLLLAVSLIDLDKRIIPNKLVLAGIVAWLVEVLFGVFAPFASTVPEYGLPFLALDPHQLYLANGLLGAFVVAGGLLLVSIVFDKIIGRQSLGGGDVKLLFMVGLFLGLAPSVFNLIAACFIGLFFAAVTARSRKEGEDPKVFPFGPSIALATWVSLLFANPLLMMYFSLF